MQVDLSSTEDIGSSQRLGTEGEGPVAGDTSQTRREGLRSPKKSVAFSDTVNNFELKSANDHDDLTSNAVAVSACAPHAHATTATESNNSSSTTNSSSASSSVSGSGLARVPQSGAAPQPTDHQGESPSNDVCLPEALRGATSSSSNPGGDAHAEGGAAATAAAAGGSGSSGSVAPLLHQGSGTSGSGSASGSSSVFPRSSGQTMTVSLTGQSVGGPPPLASVNSASSSSRRSRTRIEADIRTATLKGLASRQRPSLGSSTAPGALGSASASVHTMSSSTLSGASQGSALSLNSTSGASVGAVAFASHPGGAQSGTDGDQLTGPSASTAHSRSPIARSISPHSTHRAAELLQADIDDSEERKTSTTIKNVIGSFSMSGNSTEDEERALPAGFGPRSSAIPMPGGGGGGKSAERSDSLHAPAVAKAPLPLPTVVAAATSPVAPNVLPSPDHITPAGIGYHSHPPRPLSQIVADMSQQRQLSLPGGSGPIGLPPQAPRGAAAVSSVVGPLQPPSIVAVSGSSASASAAYPDPSGMALPRFAAARASGGAPPQPPLPPPLVPPHQQQPPPPTNRGGGDALAGIHVEPPVSILVSGIGGGRSDALPHIVTTSAESSQIHQPGDSGSARGTAANCLSPNQSMLHPQSAVLSEDSGGGITPRNKSQTMIRVPSDLVRRRLDDKVRARIENILELIGFSAADTCSLVDATRVLVNAGMTNEEVAFLFPELKSSNAEASTESPDMSIADISRSLPTLLRHGESEGLNPSMREKRRLVISRDLLRKRLLECLQNDSSKLANMEDINVAEARQVGAARMVLDSRLRQLRETSVRADGVARRTFDTVICASLLYFFLVATYVNHFYVERESISLYWSFVVVHALWLADLVVVCISPTRNEATGKVATSFGEVARLQRWNILGLLITLIPADLVLYWFVDDGPLLKSSFAASSSGMLTRSISLTAAPAAKVDRPFQRFENLDSIAAAFVAVRLFKAMRVLRILTLFEVVNTDVIVPSTTTFFFVVKPLMRFVTMCVVAVHASTVVFHHAFTNPMYATDYLTSVVLVVALLCGSGPSVSMRSIEDNVVGFISIVAFVLIQGVVIGKLAVDIFRSDINSTNLAIMRETLAIVSHYKVPTRVQTEILSYQFHALNDDIGRHLSNLATLPPQMQREVLLYVKIDAVNNVRLFASATQECKMMLAAELTASISEPDVDIVTIGDAGEEMYAIVHGYANVIIVTGAIVATLSRGDYFGEVALLLESCTRQATVRALTYCDMWCLSKESFLSVLESYPSLLHAMKDDLQKKNIDTAHLVNTIKEINVAERAIEIDELLSEFGSQTDENESTVNSATSAVREQREMNEFSIRSSPTGGVNVAVPRRTSPSGSPAVAASHAASVGRGGVVTVVDGEASDRRSTTSHSHTKTFDDNDSNSPRDSDAFRHGSVAAAAAAIALTVTSATGTPPASPQRSPYGSPAMTFASAPVNNDDDDDRVSNFSLDSRRVTADAGNIGRQASSATTNTTTTRSSRTTTTTTTSSSAGGGQKAFTLSGSGVVGAPSPPTPVNHLTTTGAGAGGGVAVPNSAVAATTAETASSNTYASQFTLSTGQEGYDSSRNPSQFLLAESSGFMMELPPHMVSKPSNVSQMSMETARTTTNATMDPDDAHRASTFTVDSTRAVPIEECQKDIDMLSGGEWGSDVFDRDDTTRRPATTGAALTEAHLKLLTAQGEVDLAPTLGRESPSESSSVASMHLGLPGSFQYGGAGGPLPQSTLLSTGFGMVASSTALLMSGFSTPRQMSVMSAFGEMRASVYTDESGGTPTPKNHPRGRPGVVFQDRFAASSRRNSTPRAFSAVVVASSPNAHQQGHTVSRDSSTSDENRAPSVFGPPSGGAAASSVPASALRGGGSRITSPTSGKIGSLPAGGVSSPPGSRRGSTTLTRRRSSVNILSRNGSTVGIGVGVANRPAVNAMVRTNSRASFGGRAGNNPLSSQQSTMGAAVSASHRGRRVSGFGEMTATPHGGSRTVSPATLREIEDRLRAEYELVVAELVAQQDVKLRAVRAQVAELHELVTDVVKVTHKLINLESSDNR